MSNQNTNRMIRVEHTAATASQRGAAAIIVTLITMVIVSLIVLGFASISRREQRLTLDQQLSAQAFYAAESAVEDVKKVLQDDLAANRPLVGKQRCDTNDAGGNYPVAGATVIDDNNDVSFTCLKVDVTPSSLVYDDVGENNVIVPIKTAQPISRLVLAWQPSTLPTGTPVNCPSSLTRVFSPQPGWSCGYGVMRSDLVPVDGAIARADLQSNTLTAFNVPNRSGSGRLSFSAAKGNANTVAANCGMVTYTSCQVEFDNLPPTQEYSLRLNAIYRSSRVIITAYDNNNLPLDFQEGQAVVDATGKAQDVLRRIQVRLPIKPGAQGPLPTFAVQSNAGVCKRMRIAPGYFNIPGDIAEPDASNSMCVAKTSGALLPSPPATPPPTPGFGVLPPGLRLMFAADFNARSEFGTCQMQSYNASCSGYTGDRFVIANGGLAHEQAGRFEVRQGDTAPGAGGNRSEARVPSASGDVAEGDERWYEFSVKFDDSFQNPRGDWFIIMQWHAGSGSPPLAINVENNGDVVVGGDGVSSAGKRVIGQVQKGQWNNYVLHVKFSRNASNGYVEAWRNGTMVLNKWSRATMTSSSNYLKLGTYRDSSNTFTSVVFIDDFRIYQP